MGLYFGRSIDTSQSVTPSTPTTPNPNRFRFEVLNVAEGEKYVLAEIRYEDATTYEGRKLLLFTKVDYEKCIASKEMDPHFLPDVPTPLARFKPDEVGKRAAKLMLTSLETQFSNRC